MYCVYADIYVYLLLLHYKQCISSGIEDSPDSVSCMPSGSIQDTWVKVQLERGLVRGGLVGEK